jgi:hypothetical protein
MTARLVTFPLERARPPSLLGPIGGFDARIIILPVVRIENYLEPQRPRRRRHIEITEGGERP